MGKGPQICFKSSRPLIGGLRCSRHWRVGDFSWSSQLALPAWGMGPGTSCQANNVPLSLVFGCLPLPFSLQAVASAAQASLIRQQEELDRKAAELERKERELQNTVANLHGKGGHTRSWVPLLGAGEFPQPACSWGSCSSLLSSWSS